MNALGFSVDSFSSLGESFQTYSELNVSFIDSSHLFKPQQINEADVDYSSISSKGDYQT